MSMINPPKATDLNAVDNAGVPTSRCILKHDSFAIFFHYQVIMVTDDHPITAQAISKQVRRWHFFNILLLVLLQVGIITTEPVIYNKITFLPIKPKQSAACIPGYVMEGGAAGPSDRRPQEDRLRQDESQAEVVHSGGLPEGWLRRCRHWGRSEQLPRLKEG